jgi:hypothetical protein
MGTEGLSLIVPVPGLLSRRQTKENGLKHPLGAKCEDKTWDLK